MAEKENPYTGWSQSRLEKHKGQIEEALTLAKLNQEGLDAATFRKVHSRPECKLEREEVGARLGAVNEEGVQIRATLYIVKCITHNITSG